MLLSSTLNLNMFRIITLLIVCLAIVFVSINFHGRASSNHRALKSTTKRRLSSLPRCPITNVTGSWVTPRRGGPKQYQYKQKWGAPSCNFGYFSGRHLRNCLQKPLRVEIWGDSTSRLLSSSLMCYIEGAVPFPEIPFHRPNTTIIQHLPSHVSMKDADKCFEYGSEPYIKKCMYTYYDRTSPLWRNHDWLDNCRFENLVFDWQNEATKFSLSFKWVGLSSSLTKRFEASKDENYQAPDILIVNTGLHVTKEFKEEPLDTCIRNFLTKIQKFPKFKNTKIFWLEPNILPPGRKFRSSNPLLSDQRRQIGLVVAESVGIPIIRTSHLLSTSDHFNDETLDLHYPMHNHDRAQLILNLLVRDDCYN